MADPAPPRSPMQVRLFRSNADADEHDAEYWARIPPEERLWLTWRMTVEHARMMGADDEPRLRRDIVRLIRG